MPGLVVDASVTAGWFIADEASAYADAALVAVASGGAIVPSLWIYETSNLLATAERRGRITSEDLLAVRESLAALRIEPDQPHIGRTLPALLRLAQEHGLSTYDAAYLELATRTGSALATLDGALREAATRAGVPLLTA